jgi:error-prone DNA polymerase
VKDAQRHGLRIRHIDINQSETLCSVSQEADGQRSLRLGLNYVKGLDQAATAAIVSHRQSDGAFLSTDDLARRVPALNRRELVQLARIGALNNLGDVEHRRDALWQVEQAARPTGPLLSSARAADGTTPSPLRPMATEERLVADYSGTGLTTGPHPMSYQRSSLRAQGVLSAAELATSRNGDCLRTAGCVIARQRPGTASGFVFLSLEDETGIANIIVSPDLYERERIAVTRGKFLLIGGRLQNEDGVIHIRAVEISSASNANVTSHDFH